MTTIDSNALECLAAIVEEGGFERAAVRLSITQSAVSQRLRSLEVQVGTVLIVRSRPLKPTSAGRLLLKHALQTRLLRADLERDLKDLAPGESTPGRDQERISIAINADSIATWALLALSGLARQGLGLEIITDDQDCTIEWLREGQVLGCVTTLKQALRSCKQVPLGAMRYLAVADPLYAAQHCPNGLTPHNFRNMPFSAFNASSASCARTIALHLNIKFPQKKNSKPRVTKNQNITHLPLLLTTHTHAHSTMSLGCIHRPLAPQPSLCTQCSASAMTEAKRSTSHSRSSSAGEQNGTKP